VAIQQALKDYVFFVKDTGPERNGMPQGLLRRQTASLLDRGFACATGLTYMPLTSWLNFSKDSYLKHHDQQGPAAWAQFSSVQFAAWANATSFHFQSPLRPLRAWLQSITDSTLYTHLTTRERVPCCLRGFFSVERARILGVNRTVWRALRASLAREDNIEESHYAERSWAALLA